MRETVLFSLTYKELLKLSLKKKKKPTCNQMEKSTKGMENSQFTEKQIQII